MVFAWFWLQATGRAGRPVSFEEVRSMPYISRIIGDVPALFVWYSVHRALQEQRTGGVADIDFSKPVLWHLDLVLPPLLVRRGVLSCVVTVERLMMLPAGGGRRGCCGRGQPCGICCCHDHT